MVAMLGLFGIFGRSTELRRLDGALRGSGLHPRAVPEAVKLTGFLAYDLDAAAILGVERGVPGDKRARDFLLDKVNPVERKMIDYLDIVAGNVSPLPPPPPKGAGEVESLLRRFYPELAFGRMTVEEGAERFFKQAQAVIRRA